MKKTFAARTWAILLFAVLPMLLFQCKRASDKTAEQTAETIIETASGEKVDIDQEGDKISIKTDEGQLSVKAGEKSWPKDMPKDVPVLSGGQITNTATSQAPEADTWSLVYEGLTTKHLEDYETALKNAGYKTALFRMGDGASVSGEKGKLTVACFIGDGDGALTVSRRKN